MKDKVTIIIGVALCTFFLIGLATTLTRSMMIGFFDVLPVYILMGMVIVMMFYASCLYFNGYGNCNDVL